MKFELDKASFARLKKALEDLPKKSQARIVMRAAIKKASESLVETVKDKVVSAGLVDTGNLREQIRSLPAKSRRGEIVFRVDTGEAYYGRFWEYGFSRKTSDGRAQITARPFMRPAIDESFDRLNSIIFTEIGKGIEQIWLRESGTAGKGNN